MTNEHFARHILQSGDSVRTVFECRAPETAPCRTICRTCLDEGQESGCVCDQLDLPREPNPEHGRPCNYISWMEQAPEESYGGDEIPVQGPEWQPVVFTWEGDYFIWEYAAADDPVEELCNAIRLTVEYVGTAMLPPIEGWSWFDALKRYRPKMAQAFTNQVSR